MPVQASYTSVPRPLYQEVKDYLQYLIVKGFISSSKSPYSSPMVCARKRDSSLRLCIDYRKLNNKTVKNGEPIPRIQDTLDGLAGSQWFSVLDQGKAYHQGVVSEECKQQTAFVTPSGLCEWNKIPFGLTGAPSTFQRFINEVLGDYRDKFCIPYSRSFVEHLQNLRAILRRLKEKGLKLKPRKCELFRKSVRYLGCRVSRDGYQMDPADKEAIVKLKDETPKSIWQVRKLIGFLGYYRKYIPDYARRTKKKKYDMFQAAKKSEKSKRGRTNNGQIPSS